MLVLSRKAGESVYIGNDISVTIVRISGSQVRIKIDAPKSVPVVREELIGREFDLPLTEDWMEVPVS